MTAETYPTEDELSNALDSFPSWTDLRSSLKATQDVDHGTAPAVTADDMAAVDALIDAQASIYAAGFRDGHAAGLLEADRDVADAVRRMLDQLENGGGLL